MFTDGYISSVVAPIIPYIVADERLVANERVQMATSTIVACFGVSDIIGGPLCAWYIDSTGKRRLPFLAGLGFMAAGTLLFGLATTVWMLALGRLVQGFASSILYTAGLAVLVDAVQREEFGRWMGTAMSCNNIAIILSPVIGGVMYDILGKGLVFGSMMALIVIDAILRVLMVDPPPHNRPATQDGCNLGGNPDLESICDGEAREALLSGDPGELVDSPEAVTLQKSSQKIQIMVRSAQIPGVDQDSSIVKQSQPSRMAGIFYLISSPRLLAALYGTFVNECLISSLCATLPLFASRSFGWSSLVSGLLFLTIAIPGLCGPLAGYLADRIGPKPVALGGFFLTSPLLVALRFVEDVKDETGKKSLLCALLVMIGFTIIFFLSPLGADLSFVADDIQSKLAGEGADRSSSASGEAISEEGVDLGGTPTPTLYASTFSIMNCALATATVVGPLLTGWLNQEYGWKTATMSMGVLCLSGALPCWLFTGGGEKDILRGSESSSEVQEK